MRDLYDATPVFPKDTLQPGARWILQQIDFPNALDYVILQEKVVPTGSDIDMCIKVLGTFFEQMELEDFPFDIQETSFVFSFSCATSGICPVAFNLDYDEVALSVNVDNFAFSNLWESQEELMVTHYSLDPMPGTSYPALKVSALVIRRPGFIITNVVIPIAVLTALSTLQVFLPGTHVRAGDRVAYSVTILLTSATYKLFVASSVPAIAYLTHIDKFILACFLLQASVVAEGAVMGAFMASLPDEELPEWLPKWATAEADFFFGVVTWIVFALIFVWFWVGASVSRTSKLKQERTRFAEYSSHKGSHMAYRRKVSDVNSQADTGTLNSVGAFTFI
jgi:hypothetical protein